MEANMQDQINSNLRAKQQVTAMSFASKYKSKREVYNFLTVDCHAYLPPYDNLTIYFLKDLVSDDKKSKFLIKLLFLILNFTFIVMKSSHIQHLSVPQYEGLNIETILSHVENDQDVHRHLPDLQEIRKCPKQWLINVIYTICKDNFG